MSEQAQVGDTVRLTMTTTVEGAVYERTPGVLAVGGWTLNSPNREVEIMSRAIPPLPSEPGTWWLDRYDNVWHVNCVGEFLSNDYRGTPIPDTFAPFRQLVLK